MSLPDILGRDTQEHERHRRRGWVVQRLFWLVLYLTILAILFGAIGKGRLSHARIGQEGDVLQVEYERFLRYRSPESMQVVVRNSQPVARLRMDKDYFRSIGIQRIMPEPENVVMARDAVILTFRGTPAESTTITFTLDPETAGMHHGWIAVDGHPSQYFSQFVYP